MRKIAVCGSPDFVVPFFDFIAKMSKNADPFASVTNSAKMAGFEVVCAITQVAKKANRMKTEPTAVAKWAEKNSILCFEIDKIKEADHSHLEAILAGLDCVLIFAFGKIIPQKWLDLPKFGWLNIHPSKLPEFRGPTPIQAAILAGYTRSALSLMKINARMDEGNLIAQREFEILPDDTIFLLMEKLQTWGPSWVAAKMADFLDGKLQDYLQSGQASYCHLISKSNYVVTNESAEQILAKIRAFGFVFLEIGGERVKCFAAKMAGDTSELNVQGVQPTILQRPGKKVVDLKAFLNGMKSGRV